MGREVGQGKIEYLKISWGRTQAQPGNRGRLSGCFSQIKEIREKTDFRGRERVNDREGGALDYLLVKGLDLVLHI